MEFKKQYVSQPRKQSVNNLPSMVKPEFAEESNINNIMDRYVRTGYLPPSEFAQQYGDFSIPMDFDTAQEKILNARAAFKNLPPEVREEFRTAESLIKAFSDPKGQSKLESLGLLQKLEQAAPRAPVAESEGHPQKKPVKGEAS